MTIMLATTVSQLILKSLSRSPSCVNIISHRMICKSSMSPRVEGKHYRLWSLPGDRVFERMVLAKQYLVKWHPGINAGMDEDRTVYALVDGTMVITEEKFDADYNNPLVEKIYGPQSQKMAPQIKRYIHVIPDRRIPEFKLIDVV